MKNKWLAAPYVVWMAIFVVAPLILVVIFAFTDKAGGLTLDNFSNMATYIPAFQHSFVLAIAATLICILIGYPLAYFLSRESLMVRKVAMMLIMLPMWMNFLLRTYAWMSILDDNGLINQFLANIGFFNLINSIFGTNLQYIHMINTPSSRADSPKDMRVGSLFPRKYSTTSASRPKLSIVVPSNATVLVSSFFCPDKTSWSSSPIWLFRAVRAAL